MTTNRLWTALKLIAGVFLCAFGGFVMSVGQADDSPGLGGLGLITVAIGLVMLVVTLRAVLRGRRVESTPLRPDKV